MNKKDNRADYLDSLKKPKIYCYTTPEYKKQQWSSDSSKKGLIKVGYTERNVETRVREQFPTIAPNKNPFEILYSELAIKNNGEFFRDNDKGGVHEVLERNGFTRVAGEWFECTVEDVKNAILSIKEERKLRTTVTQNFKRRPEQNTAVKITKKFFKKNINKSEKPPHFLWNAKMRFGKTFSTYQLASEMDWKRVMVLTYKPAVENEWREQLENHIDFENFQFFGRGDDFSLLDTKKPIFWFASFQDILGTNLKGGIKEKFEKAYKIKWDCIVLDEYHFGAWNEASKELYDSDKSEKIPNIEFKESRFPLEAKSFLYLSGTPFRALREGEFMEDQIFNWSYIDEQKAKKEWGDPETNPYLELPKIVMLTYELPNELRDIALKGEMNEFDLNEFFKAEIINNKATFIYKDSVQKWLSLIRGQYLQGGFSPDSGVKKPPLPFDDAELLTYMNHSLWFLPNVVSCEAMENLLKEKTNNFFHDYKINLAAGKKAGIGLNALPPVKKSIGDGLTTKTITLTCMKLTTGVTVPEWCSIFMLRNCSSPETYFQAAFRVQSPWVLDNKISKEKEILKTKCFIFDFAPNRALRLIENYSTRLNLDETQTIEDKVEEFLNFLPVLQYDNFSMKALDAKELLSFASSGIGATMLARRWQSPSLVRVDNDTLERLLKNPDIVEALQKIEAFRNLSKDLTKIISTEKALDKKTKEQKPKTKDDKKQEKDNKSFRKELRDKLLKFITRVPIFMYLTDFREESLKDVIMQLERDLFTKVSGLTIKDFEKLCLIGVFNEQAMNSSIYAFRKYEEASLDYVGGGTKLEKIGLFDSTISSKDEI